MRTSLADCNILTLPAQYGTCFKFELINIRGNECVDCTAPIWIEPKLDNSLHTDSDESICEFNGTGGAVHSEDNFGSYANTNPSHRCSSGPESTTQFWLGGL